MWFNSFVEQEFHNGQLKKREKIHIYTKSLVSELTQMYMQQRCMFHTCQNRYIHNIVYLHCSLHIH